MKVLDENASNLAQSEYMNYCMYISCEGLEKAIREEGVNVSQLKFHSKTWPIF
jgi:hypothetical protein